MMKSLWDFSAAPSPATDRRYSRLCPRLCGMEKDLRTSIGEKLSVPAHF